MSEQSDYRGWETEVDELLEASAGMAKFLEEEIGMDKTELTRLWCALKPFGFDRADCKRASN